MVSNIVAAYIVSSCNTLFLLSRPTTAHNQNFAFGQTMATLRDSTTLLSLSSGSVILLFLLNRYIPSCSARLVPRATWGHETSLAVTVLNPRRQDLFQHAITLDIPASQLKSGIDNEEVLTRFTQGFFGGWIFSPERWFFAFTGLSVTNLDGKYL